MEHISQSLSFLDLLKSLVDLEDKLIRIVHKSEAGWAAVDEFLSDEVASGSEDEKKIRAAEQKALRKKKYARIVKSGHKLSIFICYFYSFPLPALYFL